MDLKYFAKIAASIADQTRQQLKQERQRYLYSGREFDTKDDLSPVTLIDRQVEQLIRGQLTQAFPSHGILGEVRCQRSSWRMGVGYRPYRWDQTVYRWRSGIRNIVGAVSPRSARGRDH